MGVAGRRRGISLALRETCPPPPDQWEAVSLVAPGLPPRLPEKPSVASRDHSGGSRGKSDGRPGPATPPRPGPTTRRVYERLYPPPASFHLSIAVPSPTRPNTVTGKPLYRKLIWFTGLPNRGGIGNLVRPVNASSGRSRRLLGFPAWAYRFCETRTCRPLRWRGRTSAHRWSVLEPAAVPPGAHSTLPSITSGGSPSTRVFRRPGLRG